MTLLQLFLVSAMAFSISGGQDACAVTEVIAKSEGQSASAVAEVTTKSECQDTSALSKAIDQFGIDIHRKVGVEDDGNLFNSPLGVSAALGMLYYGSRGKTAEELECGLGYKDAGITDSEVHASFRSIIEEITKDSDAKGYRLGVTNAVFIRKDYPILPEYKDGLQNYYKAIAREIDFQNEGTNIVEKINDLMKLNKDSRIGKSCAYLGPSTIIILLNVMYFEGAWKTRFDPKDNTCHVFYNRGRQCEQTTIQMMHLVEELPYRRIRKSRMIELPYRGENVAMIIILPNALDGAYELEQELTPAKAIEIIKGAKKIKLQLSLPKFSLEDEKNLKPTLKELGIKRLFGNNSDLSGISKSGPIFLSQVVHKTSIEVNEEGSGFPEVTGEVTGSKRKSGGIPFVVDRPFLFAIYDKRTGVVYFKGRVSQL